MLGSIKLPGYRWFAFLEDAAIRVGTYTGACLAITFTAWIVAANRVPALEGYALARNLAAVAILTFFALLPILRFYRAPYELLLSGLLAWSILCLTFRLLSFEFTLLDRIYSSFQIFVLGAVVYLISATLSWIGTIIWRVRIEHVSHLHH